MILSGKKHKDNWKLSAFMASELKKKSKKKKQQLEI